MTIQRRISVILAGIVASTFLTIPTVAHAQGEEDTLFGVSYLLCCGAVLLINVLILVWVVKDAQERGASAGAWLLIVLIFGFLGLLGYLVARPQGKLVPCPNCGRNKPIRDQVCPHCGSRVA